MKSGLAKKRRLLPCTKFWKKQLAKIKIPYAEGDDSLVGKLAAMIENKLAYFINNEKTITYNNYDLSAITDLLSHFANPHNQISTIHIAGTNGKGSIAHMLNSIFINAGYTCGLYTSPHLLQVNERICVNNIPIDDMTMLRYIDDIHQSIHNNSLPTYFDVLTVMAFRFFLERKTDIAIIETGLGGRLDSTNVITPECSIISDISLDHTHVLGNSIEKIAFEKAGIIKQHVPVITTNSDDAILSVLRAKSIEMNSLLFIKDHDFIINNRRRKGPMVSYDYQGLFASISIKNIITPLIADFQAYNISAAITAALLLKKFFPLLTPGAIKNGLKQIIIPGRMQQLCNKPLIFFDPAHNNAAIQNIIALISKEYVHKKIIFIVSLMRDKDYISILQQLHDTHQRFMYYELPDPRCYKPSLDQTSIHLEIIRDELFLIEKLGKEDINEMVFFFTGSFRLYHTALNVANSFLC